MNPYLYDLPDPTDELDMPLMAHRAGDRSLDDLMREAVSDKRDWPEEWRTYERKSYPRFDGRRVRLETTSSEPSRRSTRTFSGQSVTLGAVADVLGGARMWPAGDGPRRECPSAGGLFPIECYLFMKDGPAAGYVGYYDAESHEIVKTLRLSGDVFEDPTAALGTSTVRGASAFVVLTGVMYRTMRKYGARGYRYALLEAGALAHEIDRRAREIGLATCWLGGFDDALLAELLGCRPGLDMELPLIVIALGFP